MKAVDLKKECKKHGLSPEIKKISNIQIIKEFAINEEKRIKKEMKRVRLVEEQHEEIQKIEKQVKD